MSPHRSAIFFQHSPPADVLPSPRNTQTATGSAANMSARAETPTFIKSFNITSLSNPVYLQLKVRCNRREKVSAYPRHANGQPSKGKPVAELELQISTVSIVSPSIFATSYGLAPRVSMSTASVSLNRCG